MKRNLSLTALTLCTLAALGSSHAQNAGEQAYACTPASVAVYPQRIHVRCAQAVQGFTFFALGLQNTAHTQRVLSLLDSALSSGRRIYVWSDLKDTSGVSIGCQANDCRLLSSVEVLR